MTSGGSRFIVRSVRFAEHLKDMEYRYDLLEWRREKTGESYNLIADRCGLSKSTVWLIIGGRTNPTASNINGVFKAMGLDPKFAFDFKLTEKGFRRAVVVTAR